MKTAEACFVLAGHHDGDLFEADMRHIFRVMSIQGHCPTVPIYSYSLKAPTTLQLKNVAKVRVSNQLVKMVCFLPALTVNQCEGARNDPAWSLSPP